MKKILKQVLLYSCIITLIGCGKESKDKELQEQMQDENRKNIQIEQQVEKQVDSLDDTMEVEVVNVQSGVLVIDEEYGLCRIKNETKKIIEDLSVGDRIVIKPTGTIEEESYPRQIATTDLTIVEQGIDKFQPLREAIYTMHKSQHIQNQPINVIALDLTKLSNFTVREKEALTYLISCDLNFVNLYQSTKKELLSNQQILITDNGHQYFENGILYLVQATEIEDGFTFDIERYTSSITNCKMQNEKAIRDKELYKWEKDTTNS